MKNPSSHSFSPASLIPVSWDKPHFAPDVPPLEYLAALCHHGQASPQDPLIKSLAAHVDQSPGCRETLLSLNFIDRSRALAASADELKAYLHRAVTPVSANEVIAGIVGSATAGIRLQTPTDSTPSYRWGFRAPLFLLLEDPVTDADGQHPSVARAVACSPLLAWPEENHADDEVVFNDGEDAAYVAHLWLSFPVTPSVVREVQAKIDPAEVCRVATLWQAYAEGIPLDAALDGGGEIGSAHLADNDELTLERRRLAARCEALTLAAWQGLPQSSQRTAAAEPAPAEIVPFSPVPEQDIDEGWFDAPIQILPATALAAARAQTALKLKAGFIGWEPNHPPIDIIYDSAAGNVLQGSFVIEPHNVPTGGLDKACFSLNEYRIVAPDGDRKMQWRELVQFTGVRTRLGGILLNASRQTANDAIECINRHVRKETGKACLIFKISPTP